MANLEKGLENFMNIADTFANKLDTIMDKAKDIGLCNSPKSSKDSSMMATIAKKKDNDDFANPINE